MSYQKCETVGKYGLQEAQMCGSYTLLHDPSKTGAAKSQIPMRGPYRNSEIPTTTAGGLWGAYLMTVAHF